ncbi:MAG TPA: hypothetical protein PKD09_12290 [Aggregatilinea sp.]|uniref:hypothetical protein n=1 Tax=Aggregatilinea sp. TaxID=2806333 RepID=UPI002C957E44|nr:hypothetical protein [Aggregatilinea sp.]HML22423.1 hypothetical protein [Aggregatilinea sp.]
MEQHALQRFAHTESLTLNAPPERVFPLFGPLREKEWAADWDPTLIYSDAPLGDCAGTVFSSRHPGEPDTIWYVNRFDAAQWAVEYVRVTPGLMLAIVAIQCEASDGGRTVAHVTYTFTALSDAGAAALHHRAAHHASGVRAWEGAINGIL